MHCFACEQPQQGPFEKSRGLLSALPMSNLASALCSSAVGQTAVRTHAPRGDEVGEAASARRAGELRIESWQSPARADSARAIIIRLLQALDHRFRQKMAGLASRFQALEADEVKVEVRPLGHCT